MTEEPEGIREQGHVAHHREDAQNDTAHQDQDGCRDEVRDRQTESGGRDGHGVQRSPGMHRRRDPGGNRDDAGEERRPDGQREGDRESIGDHLRHRLSGLDRPAQVPPDHPPGPAKILARQRRVELVLRPGRVDELLGRERAKHQGDRIAGRQVNEGEHQDGYHREGRHDLDQLADDVPPEVHDLAIHVPRSGDRRQLAATLETIASLDGPGAAAFTQVLAETPDAIRSSLAMAEG